MSAQPGDAPTARTLFRSPAKPAAGTAAVTPSAAARDLRAQALSTRQAVDLSSEAGLRRALGEVLLDVERAGGGQRAYTIARCDRHTDAWLALTPGARSAASVADIVRL